ncbi:hypothetical protein ZWY2020_038522 [Hordeum vulgare]|nr:hypothetical protein ZWY2020_038522 [Hordeum vulgare]
MVVPDAARLVAQTVGTVPTRAMALVLGALAGVVANAAVRVIRRMAGPMAWQWMRWRCMPMPLRPLRRCQCGGALAVHGRAAAGAASQARQDADLAWSAGPSAPSSRRQKRKATGALCDAQSGFAGGPNAQSHQPHRRAR